VAGAVIVLGSLLLPGDWPIAGVIIGVLIAIGSVIQYVQAAQHGEAENQFARIFPGYSGERIPISTLVRYEGPEGAMNFDPNMVEFSLGVSPRYLFPIRHRRASGPGEAAGDLVIGPDGDPLRLRRDEIAQIQVRPLSDDQIAKSAEPGEWVANLITKGLLGASVRTIPYAAFVSIVLARGGGSGATFLIGIPTELPATALQTLASSVTGAIAGGAQDVALAEIGEEFGEIVGQDAADLLLGGGMIGLGALAGSADGRKGRLMAALLAMRIRQLAGS
jgi:hypothetical protein